MCSKNDIRTIDKRLTVQHGMAHITFTAAEYQTLAAGLMRAAEVTDDGDRAEVYHLQAMYFSAVALVAEATHHLPPEGLAALRAFARQL